MKNLLCDEDWLLRLAYLADIFEILNRIKMGLQGANTTPSTVNGKVNSLKAKLVVLCSQIQEKNFAAFLTLSSFF